MKKYSDMDGFKYYLKRKGLFYKDLMRRKYVINVTFLLKCQQFNNSFNCASMKKQFNNSHLSALMKCDIINIMRLLK